MQEGVHQALRAWAFHQKPAIPLPLDVLQGSLAGVEVERIIREDRKAELAKDKARLR